MPNRNIEPAAYFKQAHLQRKGNSIITLLSSWSAEKNLVDPSIKKLFSADQNMTGPITVL